MYKGKVLVTLKKGVLDPQGDAVKRSFHVLNYKEVEEVRVGKYIEVLLNQDSKEAAYRELVEMCDRLRANPVIEQYEVEVAEVE
ncbi:MAG: phosphoribosylformylglycinamidine synthase subunit PurS [Syntrophomonadaceae bacterium]|nr:phosphoribosylformylglycinamidine synthase subunit PurS [Syntrophomonadaceae bacterium]